MALETGHQPGRGYIDQNGIIFEAAQDSVTAYAGGGLQTLSFTPSITAFATGGQTSAVALTSMINRVSTVATQGDSVKLPAAAVGLTITVINRGAQAMQVFGAGTDTINGIATA